MKIRTQLASLIVLTCILLAHALAQNNPADLTKRRPSPSTPCLGDHTKVHQLVTDLQQAVAKHDAAAVAALVHYPIEVKLHGKPTYLE